MSSPGAAPHQLASSGLKSECLSFWEVVAQSVANIAPSATPAFIIPLVFASARDATWLTYVLATLLLLLVTYHINRFAERSASPGALYTFVAKGMGVGCGVLCGWSLVIAYLFTGSAVMAGAANYVLVLLHLFIGSRFDLPLAGVAIAVLAGGAWWIAYSDIKLSARAMLWLEFISVGLILLLTVLYFIKRVTVTDPAQFQSHLDVRGVARGLVLAVFSFVGFESATALGHEAKDPLRSIPRAVLVTVLVVGALFVFFAYSLVAAFRNAPVALDHSDAPLSVMASLAGMPAFGIAIAAGAVISFFACAIASVNAGARVLFLMARHGFLHRAAGSAHARRATPHIAVSLAGLFCLGLPTALLLAGGSLVRIFGALGSIATFGFLLSYVLISVAAPAYMKSRGSLTWKEATAGVLSLGLLSLPIAGTLYPVPDPPDRYFPIVFLTMLALPMTWFALSRRHPLGVHSELEP